MLIKLKRSIIFWFIAMCCFAMFRFYGIEQELATVGLVTDGGTPTFRSAIGALAVLGVVLGLFYALIDHFFEKLITQNQGLGLLLLLKALVYFMATVMVISIIAESATRILGVQIDIHFGWWLKDSRFWATMFYIIICSMVSYFIQDATDRFGQGMFLKMLLGTYRNPKEEKIIFMFLDLRDSTTIAERLGHHEYSKLIQECFNDLNQVLEPYHAQIYQYVGDEAVMYWPYSKGVSEGNCIKLYQAFENLRASKKDSYIKKYGLYPEFKAGIHGGKLIAVEVGQIKRELAYHGDVINTAARIQAECNKQNVNLLISQRLIDDINIKSSVSSKSVGNILLKGKQQKINIHTVT